MPLPILSIPANPAAPAIVPLHLGHDPLINIVLEDERSGVAAVEVVAAEAEYEEDELHNDLHPLRESRTVKGEDDGRLGSAELLLIAGKWLNDLAQMPHRTLNERGDETAKAANAKPSRDYGERQCQKG
ncbi:MAG: hypothetical protein LQ348_000147 [Seirophora lacunosa]|nr:MAG: hypothetical protein LQ348_000147 [Seirophora lacunosa]